MGAAYEEGSQLTSSFEYCEMRKAELTSLGASAVICVILDPNIREELWKRNADEVGPLKDFSVEMHKIDDEYVVQELATAAVIFVECGSPLPLVKNFRRKLNVSQPDASKMSLKDIVRARVLGGSRDLGYVGVSTGASLAGEKLFEMGASEVKRLGGDNSGLGLVPNCSFYPHATAEAGPMLNHIAKASRAGLMAVPDCQPVVDSGLVNGRLSHICP